MLFSKMEEHYFLIIKVLCLLFKKNQITIEKNENIKNQHY